MGLDEETSLGRADGRVPDSIREPSDGPVLFTGASLYQRGAITVNRRPTWQDYCGEGVRRCRAEGTAAAYERRRCHAVGRRTPVVGLDNTRTSCFRRDSSWTTEGWKCPWTEDEEMGVEIRRALEGRASRCC